MSNNDGNLKQVSNENGENVIAPSSNDGKEFSSDGNDEVKDTPNKDNYDNVIYTSNEDNDKESSNDDDNNIKDTSSKGDDDKITLASSEESDNTTVSVSPNNNEVSP